MVQESRFNHLLWEVFYASTCLDLMTDYKVNRLTSYLRIAINALTLITGLYVLILLQLIREEPCTYHPLNAYLSDWLPHLTKASRGLFYNIFLYLVAANLTSRLIIVCKSRRKRMRVNFFSSFFKTVNRKLTKTDKFHILLKLSDSREQIPVLAERGDSINIYRSSYFFWSKERFVELDRYLHQYMVLELTCFILFNSFELIVLETATNRLLNDGSPPVWLVAQDPQRYKAELDNGLCQVNSGTAVRVLFSLILPIIILDLGMQVNLLNVVHVSTMYLHLLWLDEACEAVSRLVRIWLNENSPEGSQSKTSTSMDSTSRFPPSPEQQYHCKVPTTLSYRLRSRDQSKHLMNTYSQKLPESGSLRLRRPLAISLGCLSAAQPRLFDILREQSSISTTSKAIGHEINRLQLRNLNSPSAAYPDYSPAHTTLIASTWRFQNTGERLLMHELLEFATKNEVVALAGAIYDTDQYVSVLNFWATLGPFGLLCLICSYWRRSEDPYEQIFLVSLVSAGLFLGISALSTAALFNARVRKLSRQVKCFISILSPTNKRRHFWDRLMMVWFTRGAVTVGYSVLGLYNATWHYLFQVVYWLSTALLLVYG